MQGQGGSSSDGGGLKKSDLLQVPAQLSMCNFGITADAAAKQAMDEEFVREFMMQSFGGAPHLASG